MTTVDQFTELLDNTNARCAAIEDRYDDFERRIAALERRLAAAGEGVAEHQATIRRLSAEFRAATGLPALDPTAESR